MGTLSYHVIEGICPPIIERQSFGEPYGEGGGREGDSAISNSFETGHCRKRTALPIAAFSVKNPVLQITHANSVFTQYCKPADASTNRTPLLSVHLYQADTSTKRTPLLSEHFY